VPFSIFLNSSEEGALIFGAVWVGFDGLLTAAL